MLSETNSHSFLPFQTCVIVRLVPPNPKRESVLALNPHRSVSSQTKRLIEKGKWRFTKKEGKKERKSGYRFQTERKKPRIVVRLEVPAHRPTQRGISTHCLKKGGATPKKQSPTNSYTPFSTLTLIVPSILRNFQRTPTISQT